jgi:pyruvate/2-oxoglutarate dehydrogenase complex dihydrolipoamide acyltransferase (E2) component
MKLMKPMLVAALVVGSLLAGSAVLQAQPAANPPAGAPPGGGGPRAGGRMMTSDAMMTRLQTALGETNKLSDAQIPKVKAVFDDQVKKMTDLRNDTTIAQADRATKRTAIQTETTDALKAVLTPAQFTIYQSLPRGGGRRGGAAPPAAGN